eukprot:scaffold152154_cov22-Tisochrysis_lutea.AAC.1
MPGRGTCQAEAHARQRYMPGRGAHSRQGHILSRGTCLASQRYCTSWNGSPQLGPCSATLAAELLMQQLFKLFRRQAQWSTSPALWLDAKAQKM